MFVKRASLLVAAIVGAALIAGPSFAADMPGKAPAKAAKSTPAAHHAKHKMSCYDYAWESQDMKNCLAKPASAPAPMHKHKAMKKAAKKAM